MNFLANSEFAYWVAGERFPEVILDVSSCERGSCLKLSVLKQNSQCFQCLAVTVLHPGTAI